MELSYGFCITEAIHFSAVGVIRTIGNITVSNDASEVNKGKDGFRLIFFSNADASINRVRGLTIWIFKVEINVFKNSCISNCIIIERYI